MTQPQPQQATSSISLPFDARTYSAAAFAVSGLALWALQRYVFKGSVDPGIAADVNILVPAVIGYTTAHLTRKSTISAPPAPTATAPTPAVKLLFPSTQTPSTPQPAPAPSSATPVTDATQEGQVDEPADT
jgi:hypothetical protein